MPNSRNLKMVLRNSSHEDVGDIEKILKSTLEKVTELQVNVLMHHQIADVDIVQ